jgi:predicted MPP superfamily phosphohydrolase
MESLVRYIKGASLGTLGFCTSWAIDHKGCGPEWVEVVEVDLQIPRLPERLYGFRIIHLSDLHCSRTVSGEYLRRCIGRVNRLGADIVVLTGDYVTHDCCGRFREKAADLISGIKSRLGVFACMGNHDYGIGGTFGRYQARQVGQMIGSIDGAGAILLRNESDVVETEGRRIRIVGLGDLWAKDLDAKEAFSKAEDDEVIIVLAHNPDTVHHINRYSFDAMFSGHTHGLSVDWRMPGGRLRYIRRYLYSGLYEIFGRKLYVNRGLGRLGKVFFNARPEITVYKLCQDLYNGK